MMFLFFVGLSYILGNSFLENDSENICDDDSNYDSKESHDELIEKYGSY